MPVVFFDEFRYNKSFANYRKPVYIKIGNIGEVKVLPTFTVAVWLTDIYCTSVMQSSVLPIIP